MMHFFESTFLNCVQQCCAVHYVCRFPKRSSWKVFAQTYYDCDDIRDKDSRKTILHGVPHPQELVSFNLEDLKIPRLHKKQ